jgi:hypothetical protein
VVAVIGRGIGAFLAERVRAAIPGEPVEIYSRCRPVPPGLKPGHVIAAVPSWSVRSVGHRLDPGTHIISITKGYEGAFWHTRFPRVAVITGYLVPEHVEARVLATPVSDRHACRACNEIAAAITGHPLIPERTPDAEMANAMKNPYLYAVARDGLQTALKDVYRLPFSNQLQDLLVRDIELSWERRSRNAILASRWAAGQTAPTSWSEGWNTLTSPFFRGECPSRFMRGFARRYIPAAKASFLLRDLPRTRRMVLRAERALTYGERYPTGRMPVTVRTGYRGRAQKEYELRHPHFGHDRCPSCGESCHITSGTGPCSDLTGHLW